MLSFSPVHRSTTEFALSHGGPRPAFTVSDGQNLSCARLATGSLKSHVRLRFQKFVWDAFSFRFVPRLTMPGEAMNKGQTGFIIFMFLWNLCKGWDHRTQILSDHHGKFRMPAAPLLTREQ